MSSGVGAGVSSGASAGHSWFSMFTGSCHSAETISLAQVEDGHSQ
jgi:hypothetical protein